MNGIARGGRSLFAAGLLLLEAGTASAGSRIKLLPPRAFRELPAAVVATLQKIGCLVPQGSEGDPRGAINVVHGRFLASDQTAWAALCSNRGVSRVVVVGDKNGTLKAELNPREDAIYLDCSGDREWCSFWRQIRTASVSQILSADRALGNTPPPQPIDHDGIEDSYDGKGSSILYLHAGKWRNLAGSD